MTKEKIIEIIADLAEDEGISIEQFLHNLVKNRNDELINKSQDLPPEVQRELITAQKTKTENRKNKRTAQEKSNMEKDIAEFKKCFPDVNAEDIPNAVWAEVEKGVSLVHAYALYIKIKQNEETYAESVNQNNSSRAVPVETDGDGETPLTREEVENMSPQAVKGNYNRVLKSLKKWKF